MKKVLFDTDIGSDIDDALALAYLLREKECELVGITTVSGEPIKRAMLASASCRAAGRDDIPIYPGMEGPYVGKQIQSQAPQAEKLPNWEHKTDFPECEAISFMRRVIRENPGEITLLAVGPMTNVATLFATDPELPSMLESLVLMCGDFEEGTERNEWNSKADYASTVKVYSTPVKLHRSFGLNVTLKLTLPREEVDQSLYGDIMAPVKDFSHKWFEMGPDKMIFHDPLAAVAVFHPEVCTYAKGKASISIDAPKRGYSTFCENPDGFHEIAVEVDRDRFFEIYLNTVNS